MVIVHDKPKTSRKINEVPVEIADLADLVRVRRGLVEDMAAAKAHIDRIDAVIKERMGDANTAKVNGVAVFTYNYKQAWRTSDLLEEHRPLCEEFFKTALVTEFDPKAFAAKHPQIAREYQTREFRTVSGDGKN